MSAATVQNCAVGASQQCAQQQLARKCTWRKPPFEREKSAKHANSGLLLPLPLLLLVETCAREPWCGAGHARVNEKR